jgi:hypothetical protein
MGSHDPTLRLVRATAVGSMVLAVAFLAWFQLTKSDVVGSASPFAEDPFDAVGSIAVEAALAIGVLSLARSARAPRPDDDARRRRDDGRFVLRGDLLVLSAVALTLATDGLALWLDPGALARGSTAAVVLILGGLVVLGAACLALAVRLATAWRALDATYPGLPSRSRFRPGMLGDAVSDVLRLGWLPLAWLGRHIDRLGRTYTAIQRRLGSSDTARTAIRLADRALGHPWACVAAIATAAAVTLVAAEFAVEGPPPSAAIGLLIAAIFVGVELAAALGGFLLFGAYLGLRPPLRDRAD